MVGQKEAPTKISKDSYLSSILNCVFSTVQMRYTVYIVKRAMRHFDAIEGKLHREREALLQHIAFIQKNYFQGADATNSDKRE